MTSSDPAELNHFAHLADQWWDPQGPLATLHAINPARLDYIQHRALLTGKRVIDVGCGGGLLTEGMASLGAEVIGIDLCEPALKTACEHSQQSGLNIEYKCISAEEMSSLYPEQFQVVTCLEMLEHCPDPAAIISACAGLAAPGADLFFSTLNRTLRAWLLAIVGAEYLLGLLPKNTHDYSRFIRPATLAHWLRTAGLTCVDIRGLRYHPLTRKATLTDDVSVNYLIHARKQ